MTSGRPGVARQCQVLARMAKTEMDRQGYLRLAEVAQRDTELARRRWNAERRAAAERERATKQRIRDRLAARQAQRATRERAEREEAAASNRRMKARWAREARRSNRAHRRVQTRRNPTSRGGITFTSKHHAPAKKPPRSHHTPCPSNPKISRYSSWCPGPKVKKVTYSYCATHAGGCLRCLRRTCDGIHKACKASCPDPTKGGSAQAMRSVACGVKCDRKNLSCEKGAETGTCDEICRRCGGPWRYRRASSRSSGRRQ